MNEGINVSLVIPVFNESKTITGLIETVRKQTLQPAEIIFVDGGSTDDTKEIIERVCEKNKRFRLIKVARAMPGEGRNIGASHSKYDWIAFTDAGIKLDVHWLEELIKASTQQPAAAIVYGNFSPQINSFFDKCAAIAYVSPAKKEGIRGKSIVSCLLKKEVWEKAGGFPPWRATEDLIFMEKAESLGYEIVMAPGAIAWWELRPTLSSTYKKFDLYSKYNVWAGRQAYWHYGVARQYALMLVPLSLAIFHSWYWILLIPAWLLARVVKRIWLHRFEFGSKSLFNPAIVFMVALITIVIDAATFSGWIKALITKNEFVKKTNQ